MIFQNTLESPMPILFILFHTICDVGLIVRLSHELCDLWGWTTGLNPCSSYIARLPAYIASPPNLVMFSCKTVGRYPIPRSDNGQLTRLQI
jgi:hypothetical protein